MLLQCSSWVCAQTSAWGSPAVLTGQLSERQAHAAAPRLTVLHPSMFTHSQLLQGPASSQHPRNHLS